MWNSSPKHSIAQLADQDSARLELESAAGLQLQKMKDLIMNKIFTLLPFSTKTIMVVGSHFGALPGICR